MFSGIRLAGATSDVHIMDVRTGKWEKMAPHGEPPSPRAAHAAAAVGSMVVVQVVPCSAQSQLPYLRHLSSWQHWFRTSASLQCSVGVASIVSFGRVILWQRLTAAICNNLDTQHTCTS